MFTINRNDVLTADRISKFLQVFETSKKPQLQRYKNYYDGKQAIMSKAIADTTKPCNKIVTNYCNDIVNNYQGYITGLPISYVGDGMEVAQDVFNYNDVKTEDSELLRQALIYGIAYEINYVDEEGKQRFKVLDSRECVPVYDNTLNKNLMYVIRYYNVDEFDVNRGYFVEVYSDTERVLYSASSLFAQLQELGREPHFFRQVPVTVFQLNSDETSIFDKIISLQDAYNTLLSSEVDDFEAFCDAYLVLKGIAADAEDIAAMKENRVLIMDVESSAEYLNKSISDTQIENMLKNINDMIHKIAKSPDFNDDKLLAQSGIAMRYKLVGFENVSSNIEANMRKALQRRLELISAITSLVSTDKVWTEVEITFTRNLPVNELEQAQMINMLRGVVSNQTLLAQLPFISDVDKEMEVLAGEQQSMSALYSFGGEA